ncbi:MAG: hypothetical protein U0Z53_04585 [Blastocatellia bacterium]
MKPKPRDSDLPVEGESGYTKKSSPFLRGVKIEIPDIRYKADLELHDRFQSFASEVMRLALAGIAAIGAFLTILASSGTTGSVKSAMQSKKFFSMVLIALITFSLSVICALLHRFLASDGMFHHMRAIKLLILKENPDANPHLKMDKLNVEIGKEVGRDEKRRTQKFEKSELCLWLSGVLLAIGAVALGIAFLMLLY